MRGIQGRGGRPQAATRRARDCRAGMTVPSRICASAVPWASSTEPTDRPPAPVTAPSLAGSACYRPGAGHLGFSTPRWTVSHTYTWLVSVVPCSAKAPASSVRRSDSAGTTLAPISRGPVRTGQDGGRGKARKPGLEVGGDGDHVDTTTHTTAAVPRLGSFIRRFRDQLRADAPQRPGPGTPAPAFPPPVHQASIPAVRGQALARLPCRSGACLVLRPVMARATPRDARE